MEEAAKPKKAGRPKTVWTRDPTDEEQFLEILPDVVEDPYSRQKLLMIVDASLCRQSFSEFVRQAWHVVEPTTTLEWNWHHEFICSVLQGLFEDWEHANTDPKFKARVLNTIFNVPPGSLKSRLLCVMFPVWCWLRKPGMKFLCLSVNEQAAHRDARDARTLIVSPWFQQMFIPDWQLKDDQTAISNYGTTKGGIRLSKALGAEVVGQRADCVAGHTSIATEIGPVEIEDLHQMEPGTWPKVWSFNHKTNKRELKPIKATRRIASRPVVEVRTNTNNLLVCTDAHRIYSEESYTKAAHLEGCAVSVMSGSNLFESHKTASTMPELSLRRSGVRSLSGKHSTLRGRARQEGTQTSSRPVLQQAMQRNKYEPPSDLEGLPALQQTVSSSVNQSIEAVLQQAMLFPAHNRTETLLTFEEVRAVRNGVSTEYDPSSLLFDALQEHSSFNSNARFWEQQLLGQSHEVVSRGTLEQLSSTNSSEGRADVRDLRPDSRIERSGIAGSSYRSQSTEQSAEQSDNAVRCVSHDAPQVNRATVLSVVQPLKDGSRLQIPVYDLEVEGNHNFFAEGILVHNCLILDDPNNPKESESKVVREGINETWKTNIFNRINHPETSMRIGIQQRVHSEDWTGFVTNPDNGAGLWSPTNRLGWLLVALPAEFEPERKCITPWGSDIRTEKGQPLHDVRMTPEFLEAEKKRFGSQGYAGQMQQRPTLAEGGTVKMRWWRYFHYEGQTAIAPSERKLSDEQNMEVHSREVKKTHGYGARWDFDWTAISLDPAAKATERGSQHGILVISGKGPQRFVRADKTFRGDVLEVIRVMLQLCKEYDPNRILIEAKAAGPALMTMFEERFQRGEVVGMDGRPLRVVVDSIEPMGDKMARVDSCLPELESGLVHLWDGADWLKPFVEEVCGFPLASYDDRIDSLSQCLNHMRSWNSYQLPSW